VHGGLRHSSRVGLKGIYTALLISTMEQSFSSVKALSKYVLIPAESGIFMLLGINDDNV